MMKGLLVIFCLLTISSSVALSQGKGIVQLQAELEELNRKISDLEEEKKKEISPEIQLIENIQVVLQRHSKLDESTQAALRSNIEKFKRYSDSDGDKAYGTYYDMLRVGSNLFGQLRRYLNNHGESQSQSSPTEIVLNTTIEEAQSLFFADELKLFSYDRSADKYNFTSYLQEYKGQLSYEEIVKSFNTQVKEIENTLNTEKKRLQDRISKVDKELKGLKEDRIKNQVDQSESTAYDRTVFIWGFPVFIIFILLLYLLPLWLLLRKKDSSVQASDELFKLIYGSGLLTEIITVFLLTSIILLLGITNKLNPEILGTLIGGISGYILGRSFRVNNEANSN